jgi:hypothetical protein
MSIYPTYSPLFSTIYDEQKPVGHLGRGTHYSVFRCAEWLDIIRSPLQNAQIHDFAVIWDEDHDTRIFSAIERIYISGLLSPVQFIGERKGMLTVIVAARFYYHGKEEVLTNYKQQIGNISHNLGFDSWLSKVGSFDRAPGSSHQCIVEGIISDQEHRVITYLRNIDSLWNLGTKEFVPGTYEK